MSLAMMNKNMARMIGASKETPWLVCLTCGRATNKIIKRHSDTLRPSQLNGKVKTYSRTIKPSDKWKSKYRGKECRQKEMFFSYFMLDCIGHHHKLSVRKAPFSSKLVTKIV